MYAKDEIPLPFRPETRTITHAGIQIELRERSTSKNGDIIVTQLFLSRENINLTVVHYQWTSWPDKQVFKF